MNKGIYQIAAGVGAAVILVSSATAQAATVTANGTPAPVASDSIAGWPAAPAVTSAVRRILPQMALMQHSHRVRVYFLWKMR